MQQGPTKRGEVDTSSRHSPVAWRSFLTSQDSGPTCRISFVSDSWVAGRRYRSQAMPV
uniref:Uncharacterized protein n=1 Tax=Arundo donax TaxID=35708 RepID=A0A0A9C9F5_ARUDO